MALGSQFLTVAQNTNWLILREGYPEQLIRGPVPIATIKLKLKYILECHPNFFWGLHYSERILFVGSESWIELCVSSIEEGVSKSDL